MKLYTVYRNWTDPLKVYEIEVQETKKGYKVLDRSESTGAAFGYRRYFSKDEYATTPLDAVIRYIRRKELEITGIKQTLSDAHRNLVEAVAMKEKMVERSR